MRTWILATIAAVTLSGGTVIAQPIGAPLGQCLRGNVVLGVSLERYRRDFEFCTLKEDPAVRAEDLHACIDDVLCSCEKLLPRTLPFCGGPF